MIRTDIQENPDGTFRILIWDQGSGHVIEKYPKKDIYRDNIPTYDEALEIVTKIDNQLNKE